MEIEYLQSIFNISLYLQYNTIEGRCDQKFPIPSVRGFVS